MKVYGLFGIKNENQLPEIFNHFPDLQTNKNAKIYKHRILVLKESTLYQQMKDFLDSSKISYIYNEQADFEPKEYRNAELLSCVGSQINDWGYEYDTRYEILSGCDDRDCPSIEKQVSPVHLDTRKFGNHDFKMLLSREFIISKRFRDLIETQGLTGCDFAPVMHRKTNQASPDIFQLIVTNVLPDIAPEFKRENIQCDKCGTQVLIRRDWLYSYHKSALKNIMDFNLTKEYFSVTYPYRVLIISQKVYQLIKEYKIKGPVYVPVRLIE